MSLKIILNIGAQFQYSDRLIENSNPQKITFSEVLCGALPVLSWQPISLFISELIFSYSSYILIHNCSLYGIDFVFQRDEYFLRYRRSLKTFRTIIVIFILSVEVLSDKFAPMGSVWRHDTLPRDFFCL